MALGDYTKSIVTFVTALGAALQVAQAGGITGDEWTKSVVGAVIAALLVWAVPNSGTFSGVDTSTRNAIIAKKAAEAQKSE